MPYVFDGTGYRAGAAGVESDLSLRDYYAQQAAQSLGAGMNMPTTEQIGTARGDLGGAMAGYQDLMANGMYSPNDINAILSNRVQQVNNTTRAMQQNFNAAQAARGLGGNAGATMAGGLAGQFAAAGQRGQAYGDLMSEQAQSKVAGLGGYAALSGQMSNLAATPTRMDIDEDDYSKLYDKWRNAQVGYDNAQWGAPPTQPDFYSAGSGAGTGGGTVAAPPTPNDSFNLDLGSIMGGGNGKKKQRSYTF